jgi:hypothetical protein
MNLHQQPKKLRLWLAVILLILSVIVFWIATAPEMRVQQVVPLPPVVLPSPTPISLAAFLLEM